MSKDFQLYLYTVDEYRRFANQLIVKPMISLSEDYSEADYIGIQVRLMLLRKYYAGAKKENMNLNNLIPKAMTTFPNEARIFPNVSGSFLIDTPHVLSEGYEFALGKWFGKWKIYSFGGHLDSIYEKRK